jgi:hypothetical protein
VVAAGHYISPIITVVLLGSVVSDKKIDMQKGLTPHPMQSDV